MKSLIVLSIATCCLCLAWAESECEFYRNREVKANARIHLVPKCKPNGDYDELQCFQGSTLCMCWDPQGRTVTGMNAFIKTCECHMHRDRELKKSQTGLVGNFIPNCNEDGTYAKEQCHGSTGYCWCADKKGNQISENTRGKPNC